jgi:hypothetical protein
MTMARYRAKNAVIAGIRARGPKPQAFALSVIMQLARDYGLVDTRTSLHSESALSYHDALEFPNGQVVLLTRLIEGQRATVLQLPAATHPVATREAARPAVNEPSPLP